MTTEQNNQPPMVEAPIMRSQDYKVIFSNHSRLKLAQTEFGIAFGYADAVPTPGAPIRTTSNPLVEERATIILTPHHAKLLALSLSGAIKAYEAEYGKIKLELKPPVGLEKMSAMIKEEIDQGS